MGDINVRVQRKRDQNSESDSFVYLMIYVRIYLAVHTYFFIEVLEPGFDNHC